MVRFFQVGAANLVPPDPLWKQMRRLWRSDKLRRLQQTFELRHWLILQQCQLWIAWDFHPDRQGPPWLGPLHCIGTVITFHARGTLSIQLAAGVDLRDWIPLAVDALEDFAQKQRCVRWRVYCRKGWVQELPEVWKTSPTIEILNDPKLLYVRPDEISLSAR